MAETCGCKEDYYCPYAEELWAAVNAAYRRAIQVQIDRDSSAYGPAWHDYEVAKAAYREHRRQAGV